VGGGPTGRSYVVPPRPKPGRKPATDEPASKRKAQNRESQRAFRARKAAKMTEMQEHADALSQTHREEMSVALAEQQRLRLELSIAKDAMDRLAQDRDYWKDRCTDVEIQQNILHQRLREQNYPLGLYSDQQPVFLSQHSSPTRSSIRSFSGYSTPKSMNQIGCGDCKPDGHCKCIAKFSQAPNPFAGPVPDLHPPPRASVSPTKGLNFQPADPFADRETDFTSRYAKRQRVDPRPSVTLLAQDSQEQDTECGFCTDESNCMCKGNQTLQYQDVPRNGNGLQPLSGVQRPEPGSCDACQSNPKQRAWCRSVAELAKKEFQITPTSRNSSLSSILDPMEPHISDASTPYGARQTVGCSEAFKLFDGRVFIDTDNTDWMSNLRTVPPQARRDTMMYPSRQYSALELDTAGIIATLGHSVQPLQPREEDGENSDLVRMAQDFQAHV
jgi:hypothetical protein